jgi:hypothetical protein
MQSGGKDIEYGVEKKLRNTYGKTQFNVFLFENGLNKF